MAKAKSKAGVSIPLKHVHARVSYLYQAASYISNTSETKKSSGQGDVVGFQNNDGADSAAAARLSSKQSRHLIGHVRGISRKSAIRVGSEIKHSMCKRCDALLIPGQTSTCYIENASIGSAKPWADVLVIRCSACQTTTRFPVGQDRGQRRQLRLKTTDIAGSIPKMEPKTDDVTSPAVHS